MSSTTNTSGASSPQPTELVSVRITTFLTPLRQFLIVVLTTLAIMLFLQFIGRNKDTIWFAAFVGMVFYVWVNAVIGFFARQKALRYIGFSWLFYAIMCLVLMFFAQKMSLVGIENLYEYRTLFVANLVFYFVATFAVGIMRGLAFLTGIEY